MPDRIVDSSPTEGESREREQTAHIRIAVGIQTIAALDALIKDYEAIAQVDGAVRPIPPRHALIEEAIRSQIRRHRALRARGQPVPIPDKNAGDYGLGHVPRRLHAVLVQEQTQLKIEHASHTIALRDIVEAGIQHVLKKYRRTLRALRQTVVIPPNASEPRTDSPNVAIGKTSLKDLDALISDLEHAAQTDDVAEPVPARKALVLEAIRTQIQLHRRLRREGQSTPIPVQSFGDRQFVRVPWHVHAALLQEKDCLQTEHMDELDHTISLREIAEAGIRTLIADYRQRLEARVEPTQ